MSAPPEYRMRKRTIAPGWCELTCVVARADSPDYDVIGDVAREHFAMFALASAAGIARAMRLHQTEALIGDVGALVRSAFELERTRRGSGT